MVMLKRVYKRNTVDRINRRPLPFLFVLEFISILDHQSLKYKISAKEIEMKST